MNLKFNPKVSAVTVTDAAYTPGVWALANSMIGLAPLKVFFVGSPDEPEVRELRQHPGVRGVTVLPRPECSRNYAQVAKQCLWGTLLARKCRRVMFLDSDSFVVPAAVREVAKLSHASTFVYTEDQVVDEVSTSFLVADVLKLNTRVLELRAPLVSYGWPAGCKVRGLLRARDDQDEFNLVNRELIEASGEKVPAARFMNRWGRRPGDPGCTYSEFFGEVHVQCGGLRTDLAIFHWPWRLKPWHAAAKTTHADAWEVYQAMFSSVPAPSFISGGLR